jgi:hypothetical protein
VADGGIDRHVVDEFGDVDVLVDPRLLRGRRGAADSVGEVPGVRVILVLAGLLVEPFVGLEDRGGIAREISETRCGPVVQRVQVSRPPAKRRPEPAKGAPAVSTLPADISEASECLECDGLNATPPVM